jgi:hypothetical protein
MKEGRYMIIPYFRTVVRFNGAPLFIKISYTKLSIEKVKMPDKKTIIDLELTYKIMDYGSFSSAIKLGGNKSVEEYVRNSIELHSLSTNEQSTIKWENTIPMILSTYYMDITRVGIVRKYLLCEKEEIQYNVSNSVPNKVLRDFKNSEKYKKLDSDFKKMKKHLSENMSLVSPGGEVPHELFKHSKEYILNPLHSGYYIDSEFENVIGGIPDSQFNELIDNNVGSTKPRIVNHDVNNDYVKK